MAQAATKRASGGGARRRSKGASGAGGKQAAASRPKSAARAQPKQAAGGRAKQAAGGRAKQAAGATARKAAAKPVKKAVSKPVEAATSKPVRKLAKGAARATLKALARKAAQAGAGVARSAAERGTQLSRGALEAASSRRLPIQVSVDVAVPLAVVWDEWMSSGQVIEGVHRIEDVERDGEMLFGTLHGPGAGEWEAEIVDERPEQSLAWRSLQGTDCAGLVTFHRLSERLTRIELDLDVVPTSPLEAASLSLHVAHRRAEADLRRFKAHVEFINPDVYEADASENGDRPEARADADEAEDAGRGEGEDDEDEDEGDDEGTGGGDDDGADDYDDNE